MFPARARAHSTDTAHKQFWLCNPMTVEGSDCFATRTIRTREGGEFNTTTTTTAMTMTTMTTMTTTTTTTMTTMTTTMTTTTMTTMTTTMTTTTMTTMTTTATAATRDAQQLHRVKKHIICLLFLNSPRVAEATRQHTNPWNIDMIFMD